MTLNENYKKNEAEKSHGDKFIIFHPLIVGFVADRKVFLKEKELMKKTARLIGIDVPYVKHSKKKGVFVFNKLSSDLGKI